MKSSFKFSALALAATLMFGAQAQAATIVDTGTPTSGLIGSLMLDGTNWMAGKITVAAANPVIQSIQAYLTDMGNISDISTGRQFSISLYNDSSNKVGSLVTGGTWKGSFSAASGDFAWSGVTGLNFAVAAGSYWVGLEIQDGDSFVGGAPIAPPNPLSKYAFNSDGGASGYAVSSNPTYAFGLQVTAVPEPEAFAMLLAGLAVVGAASRRRSRQA